MYPLLNKSKIRIQLNENATWDCSLFLDRINFLNSYWQIFNVNLNMENCQASFLKLDVRYSTNVTMEYSIFGNWIFKGVQQVIIKNCSNSNDLGSLGSFLMKVT